MTFLLPWMLTGLIGMAIPILVHLWHRGKARPVHWAAMQFLGPPQAASRPRNLRQWILMALRMIAIAAIALALARPRVVAGRVPRSWLKDTPVEIALVIDHSLLTGRMSEGQTVFDRSIDAADEVLAQLRPGDRACVILAEHSPRLLGAGLLRGNDVAAIGNLRRELRTLKPGLTDCSIPEAIGLARQTIEEAGVTKKIVLVISDHRRGPWRPRDAIAWRAALDENAPSSTAAFSTHSMPIAPDAQFADASVSDIRLEPTVIGTARPVHVRCTVANAGTRSLPPFSARLLIDEAEIDHQHIPALAPKATTSPNFDIQSGIPTAGPHRITVSLDVRDALAADDQTSAAIDVVDRIPVLIVDGTFSTAGNPESSRFLSAAMRPDELSVLAPSVVPLSELPAINLDDYAVVVLNDCPTLPQSLPDGLLAYTRAGHGLWCILGPQTQPDFIEKILASSGLFPARTNGVRQASAPGDVIIIKEPSSPIVASFADANRNALTGARAQAWWALQPTDPATQVVIAGAGGEPLVMERPAGSAGGAVVLWTTSADGTWNNWNLMPNYVPMVIETIQHLAAGQFGSKPLAVQAGQPIEWSGSSAHPLTGATVTRPDGTKQFQPAILNDGRFLITYADTFLPGFYQFDFAGGAAPPANYAVNIDPGALSDAPLDSEDMRWLVAHGALDATTPTVVQDQLPQLLQPRVGQLEFSALMGILLLSALIAESALAHPAAASVTATRLTSALDEPPASVQSGNHPEVAHDRP